MEMWNGLPLIGDNTPTDVTHDAQFSRGAVPRDFAVDPPSMFASPDGMQLIPDSEVDARIAEQEATESSLEHLFLRAGWTNLDQGQVGYCWAHSVTHTVMLSRTRDKQPLVPLSAYAVAATIKQGRDEGGWCGLSAQFARDRGIPSQAVWPQGDRNYRTHDTPETWASAAQHKITEDWVDLTQPVYDQQLTMQQLFTQLLLNNPCAVDFNWWGHSVCAVRVVKVEAGRRGLLILNSWLNWGRHGLAVLTDSKMVPDSAVCTRAVTASDV